MSASVAFQSSLSCCEFTFGMPAAVTLHKEVADLKAKTEDPDSVLLLVCVGVN